VKSISNLRFLVAASLAAGAISQLAACGQTGPLYLPPKPKALSTPEQALTAPPQQANPAASESALPTK
jgi:predicted small lipoprotein YifL